MEKVWVPDSDTGQSLVELAGRFEARRVGEAER